MADKIYIDIDYVLKLHGDVTDTSSRLRGKVGKVDDIITSDDDIDGKLHDFMQKWDKRRGQVADTLDAVASGLHAIQDSFSTTDQKMADQVNGKC
ncbi:MAG: hypothetical protein ABIR68_03055 [Ilumatobacteraceae bacterium]